MALLFASFAAVITEQESFITVKAIPENVKEGSNFFIKVYASAHVPVNAIDVAISYPRDQIEITGFDTGQSVITLWAEDPYAENGVIYLRGGSFKKGFLGEHLIVTVRARATKTGVAYVSKDSAQFIAGDGEGTEVSVSNVSTDKSKILVANADGSFPISPENTDTGAGSLVSTVSIYIITDIDGDGNVGLNDISAFMSAWFNRTAIFDFNGDGRMTFRDFSILLADSFFK